MAESTALTKKQSLEDLLMIKSDEENLLRAYQLAQMVEQAKIARRAAAEMSKMSWGGNLSEATRYAIAQWALDSDVDPLRHLDVLGGNLYANARYYYDRVASEGKLERDEVIILAPMVGLDFENLPVSDNDKSRLKAEAQEINAERLSLQMQYGVPEAINKHQGRAAAVLVRLWWRDGGMSEGVNWAGSYGQKKGDPVGEEHPVKTAITRAFRKAAMKKVSVHQFARTDEGTAPSDIVGRYIDADRTERKRAKLPPMASYVNPVEQEMAVPPAPADTYRQCGNAYETEGEMPPDTGIEDEIRKEELSLLDE